MWEAHVRSMGVTDTGAGSNAESRAFEPPIPDYVDWVVGVVIALGGLFLTIGGTVLTFVVDRGMLEDGVESGRITVGLVERDLTRAEMLEFVTAVVDWTGIGLLVTGIGLVVFAIGYVIVRNRTHGRTDPHASAGTFRSYAIVGAVTSAVLSFIPFSPLVGSGLAGYLGRQDTGHSTSIGAFSGFLYVVPGFVIMLFLTVGLFAGLSEIGESGLGFVVVTIMLLVMVLVAAYGAGVGALGGFIGGRLAED
jgi:hypothetical protein